MKTIPQAFSIMRKSVLMLTVFLLIATGALSATEFDHSYSHYDALLKRFVSAGRVDYQGLKADPAVLNAFLDRTAAVPEAQFNAWTETERLTFLINLYNAGTLKLIIDNYPLESIKDIGNFFKGPWDQPVVQLFGETITLDNVEHDIIRKQYSEARIHLALVCAAKGCPTLRSEAYTPARLDQQLDDQSRIFLWSPAGLRIDRQKQTVHVSSIFKWYGEDFIPGYTPDAGFEKLNRTQKAVAHFCSRYLPPSQSDYLKAGGYDMKYLDYDWSLNEQ